MKVTWTTDIHLDHRASTMSKRFLQSMMEEAPEAIFVTGDISTQRHLGSHLGFLDALGIPVYFVLGNHDAYYGSVASMQRTGTLSAAASKHLVYLSDRGAPLQLTPDTAIVGHDGWYDFRLGIPSEVKFGMSEWLIIDEFTPYARMVRKNLVVHDPRGLIDEARKLADEAAAHVSRMLSQVTSPNVIVLTHVPPFAESSRYLGEPSSPEALSVFASGSMGTALSGWAEQHPEQTVTVFAGHTHDPYDYWPMPNLHCLIGKGPEVSFHSYGMPSFSVVDVL